MKCPWKDRMSDMKNGVLAATAVAIVALAVLPQSVLGDPRGSTAFEDASFEMVLSSDTAGVGGGIWIDLNVWNNGTNAVSFYYSIYVETFFIEKEVYCTVQPHHDEFPETIRSAWGFNRTGEYQVRVDIKEANGTGERQLVKEVTVVPSKNGFHWSSGTLDSLRVVYRNEPCDFLIGGFLLTRLLNTGNTTLLVDCIEYNGFGSPIGSITRVEVPPLPNNWVDLDVRPWGFGVPPGNGLFCVGINISDVNGTGRLVNYFLQGVGIWDVFEKGPLCGAVLVQPEASVGECVTVRVLMCMVGKHEHPLYGVQYAIYGGEGNRVASGYLGEVDLFVELNATWTPTAPGIYMVGINASDSNATAYLSCAIEVTVSGPVGGRLAAVFAKVPACIELGNSTTARCFLSNVGTEPLFEVQYELYGGFGNRLIEGTIAELGPAARWFLNASWTPVEKGAFEMGINASDANGTSFVASHMTVYVTAPGAVVAVSVVPNEIDIRAGSYVNAMISIWYNGGLLSTSLMFANYSNMAGLCITLDPSSFKNCSVDVNTSRIIAWKECKGIFNISFQVPSGTPKGSYLLVLSVRSVQENRTSTTSMSLNVQNPSRRESDHSNAGPPVVVVYAGFAVAAVAGVAAVVIIYGTELGMVAMLSLLIPLYSKLHKEEVLDQFTRGKIQGYITAYPGEHYNSIKTQLGLNNGVLAYHLRVLEREGFVTSLRDGVYKRFYPRDTPLPKKRGQFSAIQDMIIENIRETPGISQDGLARKMKVSNQVIYYHIRTLMAAGVVRLEKTGKETHCYLSDSDNSGSYAGLSI
jgi:predicted transcriptional regulator